MPVPPHHSLSSRTRTFCSLCALACTALLVAACRHDRGAPAAPASTIDDGLDDSSPDLALSTAPPTLRPLVLSTYDGSGQTVHPDFVSPHKPWRRHGAFLAITPYPFGSSSQENPSLFAGTDGVQWTAAPSAPNPLVVPDHGYLSDPDIVHDRDSNELFLYYRQSVSNEDRIHLIRSADGAHWSKPADIATGADNSILSPAIVRRGSGDWLMWSVHAERGCRGPSTAVELRRSTDGISWSVPVPVAMDIPRGLSPWHIDVQWIRSRHEFWALFPVKSPGGCATNRLYLATSPDGITWTTLPAPVLWAGVIPEFADIVYRSTFAYDVTTDNITFWFSGARMIEASFEWSTAVQRRPRADVFDPSLRSFARSQSLRPGNVPGGRARRAIVDARFDPP